MQDKILPQAVEAEETVIGTLLSYPDSINNVMAILTPEMFYKVDLQNIYKCCIDIIQRFGSVDLITVSNELKGKIDIIYLTELSGRVVTDRMVESHAMLVKEKYLLRK